jgi:hypothetical protein
MLKPYPFQLRYLEGLAAQVSAGKLSPERYAEALAKVQANVERRIKYGKRYRAREASKVSSEAAKVRRVVIVQHLREMAKESLTMGEMARRLEAAEVLTTMGKERWTTEQVRRHLAHALKRQPASRKNYPKVELAKSRKFPKVKDGKHWVKRAIRAKLPGAAGYAQPRRRIRSKIP